MKRLILMLPLLTGCITRPDGTRGFSLNPIKWFSGGYDAVLKEGGSSGAFMFQMLAVSALASLVVLTLLGQGKPPKGSIIIGIGAFGISAWGLMMDSIQRTANIYIPWIVGIGLACVVADFALGLWKQYKAKA